jgi:hypothetical protein
MSSLPTVVCTAANSLLNCPLSAEIAPLAPAVVD